MAKIVISGVSRVVDGEYEFEDRAFTNREWRTIKEISGVRAGELVEALAAGDNDLVVAFAKIALERHGKGHLSVDLLWDAPPDAKIQWVADKTEEADARPPDSQTPTGTESEPGNGGNVTGPSGSSGRTLSNGSDALPATLPAVTGHRV